jgi:hypothetical protein
MQPQAFHSRPRMSTRVLCVLAMAALPGMGTYAADLKKLADELVNATAGPPEDAGPVAGDAVTTAPRPSENAASASPGRRGIEKSDIRRGMRAAPPAAAYNGNAGNGNAGNAPRAAARSAGDPIPGIDITVNQGKAAAPAAGDPIPDIDITVDQGKAAAPSAGDPIPGIDITVNQGKRR